MSGLSYAGAEFVAAFEERNAGLRAELAEVLEKSAELVMWDVDVAWKRIEKAADVLVEKSSEPLTKEKAVSRLLRTRVGQELYSDYTRQQDLVRQAAELAAGNAARRGMDEWTRERTVDSVSKASAFGDEAARARAEELVADPQVARAFGERPLRRVEKTSRAWDEIEAKAARLVQKSGEWLSQAQAVDRVLQTPDGAALYGRYMADVEAGWVALAKSEGLNTGDGVSGPSMFGSADGEPLSGRKGRTARQVLVELAERLERAESDGEDTDDVLAHELRDPGVRKVVMAAVDALPESTEKASSKRELRRRLEGLEAAGRKARRRPREDPTTGAAIAKTEGAIWDTIVKESGVSPRDPNFSKGVDAFLATPQGAGLYRDYVAAFEARDAAAA